MLALKMDDLHQIELAGLTNTHGTRVPRHLFLSANTGDFQVPSFNKSTHAFVQNLKEHRYLAGISSFLPGKIV